MKPFVLYSLTVIIAFAHVSTLAEDLVVSVADGQGSEGNSGVPMIVSLSKPCDEPVRVEFTTYEFPYSRNVPYPAISRSDFAPTNGWITFAPGETNKTVIVTIIDDEINEANEPFGFGLLTIINGTSARNGVGTILDDDVMEISFNDVVVSEGQTGEWNDAIFTMSTSRATEQTLSLPPTSFSLHDGTADGTDYKKTGGPWYLGAGPARTNIFFGSFEVVGDDRNEDDETFFLYIGWNGHNITLKAPGKCTILNDDFLLSMESVTSDSLRLVLEGAQNATHVLQWSTNLTDWISFSTNVLGTDRRISVEVPNEGDRFYRAVRTF